jgi:probable phosphoglycerate mutase
MKRLLLIRHGMPHEGHAKHPGDPPLHAVGRAHARRLAARLRAEGVDRIVCSPQQRAIDTAAPLARLLDLRPEIHDGIAEVDYGTDRYRSVQTLQREEPQRWREFLADPARFFGKDSRAYEAGVLQAFEEILADPRDQCVAAFSHGMTIKTLLCAALGVRGNSHSLLTLDHCSVSRVTGESVANLRILSINESLCSPPAPPDYPGLSKETR